MLRHERGQRSWQQVDREDLHGRHAKISTDLACRISTVRKAPIVGGGVQGITSDSVLIYAAPYQVLWPVARLRPSFVRKLRIQLRLRFLRLSRAAPVVFSWTRMFAGRHRVSRAELTRVLLPAGTPD